jgi:hypothetical protein
VFCVDLLENRLRQPVVNGITGDPGGSRAILILRFARVGSAESTACHGSTRPSGRPSPESDMVSVGLLLRLLCAMRTPKSRNTAANVHANSRIGTAVNRSLVKPSIAVAASLVRIAPSQSRTPAVPSIRLARKKPVFRPGRYSASAIMEAAIRDGCSLGLTCVVLSRTRANGRRPAQPPAIDGRRMRGFIERAYQCSQRVQVPHNVSAVYEPPEPTAGRRRRWK